MAKLFAGMLALGGASLMAVGVLQLLHEKVSGLNIFVYGALLLGVVWFFYPKSQHQKKD